jgi:shikimate kinase
VNLVLMGLRGAGKTTIGRVLAAQLGRPFIDLDDLTPRALEPGTRSSVREVWSRYGEAAFRIAEAQALRKILAIDGQVIALGGGTPLAAGATEILVEARSSAASYLVYLHASPSVLRDRLAQTDHASRPSLTGAGLLVEIPTIYAQRDPIYRSLANEIIEVKGVAPESIALTIAAHFSG